MSEIKIRRLKHRRDRKALVRLARSLPEWFGLEAIDEIEDDLYDDPGLVAVIDRRRVGFVTYYQPATFPAPHRVELTWIAIDRHHHNEGIGSALLLALEEEVREVIGPEAEIIVWTVPDFIDYAPYRKTRDFYRKNGYIDWFLEWAEVDLWGMERLFLRKCLGPKESP